MRGVVVNRATPTQVPPIVSIEVPTYSHRLSLRADSDATYVRLDIPSQGKVWLITRRDFAQFCEAALEFLRQ